MDGATVEGFYLVAFRDQRSFWKWSERVAEFAAVAKDVLADRAELRPVVFVPECPARGTALRAYVSIGARGMAMRISDGALMDRTLISAGELPRGLTMLLGDVMDEAEYQKRHATRV
jgi:hypothetical protein